jgi:hypothetical protein
MLVSCLPYSSILKMEATRSSEKLINFQWATWRYIPEDMKNSSQDKRRYESLKPYMLI